MHTAGIKFHRQLQSGEYKGEVYFGMKGIVDIIFFLVLVVDTHLVANHCTIITDVQPKTFQRNNKPVHSKTATFPVQQQQK